jgi:Na+-translocating ferredoxin:NAD+ oxidoreductase RnfA subunit
MAYLDRRSYYDGGSFSVYAVYSEKDEAMTTGLYFSLMLVSNYILFALCSRSFLLFVKKEPFKFFLWVLSLGAVWLGAGYLVYFIDRLLLESLNLKSLEPLLFILFVILFIPLLTQLFSMPQLSRRTDFASITFAFNSLLFAALFLNSSYISSYFELAWYSAVLVCALIFAALLAITLIDKLRIENIPAAWRGSPVVLLTAALLLLLLSLLFF